MAMNQRELLLAHLRRHGRTSCADLERNCDVRSVTTRMSELIRLGSPIIKTSAWQPNTRGQPRRVTFYELKSEPCQPDLFPADDTAHP